VNYIEAMASFLQEQARLEELQSGYERALTLANRRAMSAEELERFRFGFKGQKEKVAKLKEGLAALEKRAQQAAPLLRDGEESGQDQLKPFLAKIEALHGERERVQDRLAKCNLRAPADGLVVKTHRLVGERCKPDQPVVSILEQGSLE